MKTFLQLLPSYVQAAALVVGGLWVYWLFVYQRKREPATNIDVDLRFVGLQKGAWIIEVTCELANKSLVRHTYTNFQVTVRYLTAEDDVADGPPEIQHQLLARKTIDDRLQPAAIGDEKRRKASRFFAGVADRSKNMNYINPGQQFHQRYVTWVPGDATFVWVQCKFTYDIERGQPQRTNTQKVFAVPKPTIAAGVMSA